jgi:hypothetical protein
MYWCALENGDTPAILSDDVHVLITGSGNKERYWPVELQMRRSVPRQFKGFSRSQCFFPLVVCEFSPEVHLDNGLYTLKRAL